MDKELFKRDPRSYALGLVEDGVVDPNTMITALLKYMSCDDVREALDANEMSPRFDPDAGDDEDEEDEE